MIELHAVVSSQIQAIGYDNKTNTLAVQFLSKKAGEPGQVFHYADVPPEKYKAFYKAESKGTYFGANIKSNKDHPFTKQPDPEPEKE